MPYAQIPKRSSVRPRGQTIPHNRSQAVRIPADFEMPGDRVMIAGTATVSFLSQFGGEASWLSWPS